MERFIGKTLVFFNPDALTMIWWDGHEAWNVYYVDGGTTSFNSKAAMTIPHAIRIAKDWAEKNISVAPLETVTFDFPDIKDMNLQWPV